MGEVSLSEFDLYSEIAEYATTQNKTKEFETCSRGYTLSRLGGKVVVSSVPWEMYGLIVFKAHQDALEAARLFGPRILALP